MWRIFDKRPNLSIIWIPDTRNKKQETRNKIQDTGCRRQASRFEV
jgi:hypothetical protein